MDRSLRVAVASASVRPAADRDTPQVNIRSSAASIAATIGGAVQPVRPAKQILITDSTLIGQSVPQAGALSATSPVPPRTGIPHSRWQKGIRGTNAGPSA